jgi:hypothetical protein
MQSVHEELAASTAHPITYNTPFHKKFSVESIIITSQVKQDKFCMKHKLYDKTHEEHKQFKTCLVQILTSRLTTVRFP